MLPLLTLGLVGVLALVFGLLNAGATTPSAFMEGGTIGGDANVRDGNDGANPPFDWANSGDGTPTNTCPAAAAGFTVVNLSGGGGLFNCGQFKNNTTTPLAPIYVGPNGTNVPAHVFTVDPLNTDQDTCGIPQTIDGDPTTYTSMGGEKNGDPLVLNAGNVETWGGPNNTTPKNDINNVYAIFRTDASDPTHNPEVFFGAERVINNGDSHIDFEFTQASVALSPSSPPSACQGKFDGHRTHGDFVASIDYTRGGTLGTFSLAQWHCNVDTHSADNSTGWVTDAAANPASLNGKTCDVGSGSTCTAGSTPAILADGSRSCGTGPHYQEVACVDADLTDHVECPPISAPGVPSDAINAVTNGAGPVPCGGWACRDGSGNGVADIDTNELMEGGVNLQSLGFTGCLSTFIPHTRSAQSFTASLKDFAIIPFNTCRTAIVVEKLDDVGNQLPGACFTFTPDPATNTGSKEICDGSADDKADANDGVVCTDGVGTGSYAITETGVPAGYIGDSSTENVTIGNLTTNATCASRLGGTVTFDAVFDNTLGTIQWEKRSDLDGALQDGATFTISPNPFDCHVPADANPGTISDDTDGVAGPGADKDPDAGQFKLERVCVTNLDGTARTYTITETGAKTGFVIDPDPNRLVPISTSDANPVIGTQGTAQDCPDTTGTPDANHTLGVAGTGADFCNPAGALSWEKRAKDASNATAPLCPSSTTTRCPLLGGASFKLDQNPHTGAAGDFAVSDCTASPCAAGGDQDPDPGQFCLDNVLLGGTYAITETAAPANYVKDGTPKSQLVNSSGTCAGTSTDAGDFINIPLSQIQVIFTSLAGADVTKASIVCADSGGATVPANSENNMDDPELDDTNETFGNGTSTLLPGTYNCTIVVDP